MTNTDVDARVSGPPVSAAAPASAGARVIDEVPADRFPIPLVAVDGQRMLGAITLDALLDRMLAT